MRLAFMALALGTACSRGGGPPAVRDAVDSHTPAPSPTSTPTKSERLLHAGHLVDLQTRAVTFTFLHRPPLGAFDDHSSFMVDDKGELHAFDNLSGKERWHAKPSRCSLLASTEGEVHCADAFDIVTFSKSDGSMRRGTSAGAKPIAQMLGVGAHLVIVRAGGVVEALEEGTGKVVATRVGLMRGSPVLVRDGGGFCGAATDEGEVVAGCWDEMLGVRWSHTIAVAKSGDPPFTPHVRALGKGFLVASTWYASPVDRAVVVRLSDGVEVARVDEEIVAASPREDGTLDGLVSSKKGLRYLEPSGAVRFSIKVPRIEDGADAIVEGTRLYVVNFPSISVGSIVLALDRTTGKMLWAAAPTLPPIAHSAYSNQVTLALRAGVLVVHGEEASADYVLLLDRAKGTELLSDVVPLW